MPADHSAVDSTLGYAFQTLHALVVLLRAADDESVSIELTDDVTLHHNRATLSAPEATRFQLAHSIRSKIPELTLSSTKLWKTIAIWAPEYKHTERYFLITCAPVSTDLQCLECLADRSDRTTLRRQMEEEAARVVDENQRHVHDHRERLSGCRAYLDLTPERRLDLLNQALLCADGPNILEIDSILDHELRNIGRPAKRRMLITRLREYCWRHSVLVLSNGGIPAKTAPSEAWARPN